jgi:hypothetical protein
VNSDLSNSLNGDPGALGQPTPSAFKLMHENGSVRADL